MGRYPKLVAWVEETIEETLTFYRPLQHHKHLKSTNMLERLNEEIRRRTYVVRISPTQTPADASSSPCRRNSRELAQAHRYLNMNDLKELKKTQYRQAHRQRGDAKRRQRATEDDPETRPQQVRQHRTPEARQFAHQIVWL